MLLQSSACSRLLVLLLVAGGFAQQAEQWTKERCPRREQIQGFYTAHCDRCSIARSDDHRQCLMSCICSSGGSRKSVLSTVDVSVCHNITLDDAFKEEKQFDKLRKENTKVAELLDIAKSLEGLQRHCSTHAAGVVISSKALTEFCPLYKGGNDEVVTQYAMGSVEKLGLLKMDFLGFEP